MSQLADLLKQAAQDYDANKAAIEGHTPTKTHPYVTAQISSSLWGPGVPTTLTLFYYTSGEVDAGTWPFAVAPPMFYGSANNTPRGSLFPNPSYEIVVADQFVSGIRRGSPIETDTVRLSRVSFAGRGHVFTRTLLQQFGPEISSSPVPGAIRLATPTGVTPLTDILLLDYNPPQPF